MGEQPSASAFAAATRVRPRSEGGFSVCVSPDWSGGAGPHGGYLAAMLLRAMEAVVGDTERPVRSVGCHYLTGVRSGADAHIDVELLRGGRTASFLSATLRQGDRTCVTATAVFARSGPGLVEYAAPPPPAALAREAVPRLDAPGLPSLFDRIDVRPALGDRPLGGSGRPRTGGWVSLPGEPVDAALLCLIADAWLPAPAPLLTAVPAAPTLTYSVLFRAPLPVAPTPVLLEVTSRVARDGLFDEDGAVWAPDGTLLVESRQLGLLR